ncbi:multidrug resistance protein homolog 49-like [Pectinophora gossypiella]|uniref:multidrug resistance protein homolog 49-like n=1 Tax=Pectinophora gossypiella TaxID=13191 RepID=UPI00214EAAD9|nr:multidrug resistance protein homolog 49-like [Pectinophora gossypiella]
MKGQSKRFVNHMGKAYDTEMGKKVSDSIGFFDLWRYSTASERGLTVLGVLISWLTSAALIAAVLVYGEFTALFVARHKADASTGHARLLPWFGGGRALPAGNRTLHMDALVEDSLAFLWASIAVMALQVTSAGLAVFLANTAANTMISRLRWRLLRAVIRQEIAFFDTNTTMNFAATLTEDMDKLKGGVGEHVVMTSYLLGTVVLGGGLALAYGWQLTLVGLSVVPVAVAVAATVAKYQTRCSAREVTAYGAAGRVVEEALAGIRTVRAYGGEEYEVQCYSEALRPAAAEARRRGLLAGAGAGLGWLLTYALNALVFGYGAALIVRDMDLPPDQQQYHPGVMVTILFCTFMAAQNIAMCHPHLEIFSTARGAARTVFPLLQRRSRIDALQEGGARPAGFKGDIQFNNLYFNYPSRPDVKVLRGLTLSVKAGETVALVGGSGCGKSTLLQLLQRMYEPESGNITVDGRPLKDLDLHHFRTSIGVVGQEPVLFSGTIRDNITIGLTDVSEADVIAAATTAHAHQFITKLADGYDTELGERGAQLSGGQKQRIAIARAVLRRPGILLLDEPTSALDPAAERSVQAALDAASAGRTTLVVSHRLQTIENADRIVYMEQGAVLEQGTHSELINKQGLYYKLHAHHTAHKSLSAVPAAEEDDDVVPAQDHRDHFRRSYSRQSGIRASRSSRGAGGVAAARPASCVPADYSAVAEPQETEEEQAEDASSVSMWQLLKLNGPEWPLLAGGGVASALVGATMPMFALLFAKVYGMFASSDAAEILQRSQLYAGLFAGVAALCGLVTFLQAWLFTRAGSRLTDRLREMTFRNFLLQEQGWFDEPANSVGALCARLAADCAAVQGATGTRLGTVLQGASTMIIGIGLAMPYSWKMTLVSLVSVPAVIGGIYLEGYVTKRAEVKERQALEHAARIATEAVLNVRTVQSLGVESTLLSRYQSALRAGGLPALSRAVRGAVYGLCLCAPTLGYAVSLAYGGYLIAREGLQYEYAILVSEALIYGAWMLAEALSFAPSFAAARRAGARIVAALARQPAVLSEPTAVDDPHWEVRGDVKYSNIHFRYPTRPNVPVLQGLQLELEAGTTLALVGGSGCGKSTLMHLLMRSYDPDQGHVELDGRDIKRSVPLQRVRGALALVQQEPTVFARSIRDNIAYGAWGAGSRPGDVSMERVVAAAQQADLHQFVTTLPLGYATQLGGAGAAALSGGQKQRVALARALCRAPRLLLLDEATSALDAGTERAVQASLEAAAAGRTTIMIAHRLSTVARADSIAVVDKGVIAERGTHEQLVRRRGLYWNLLQQQDGLH